MKLIKLENDWEVTGRIGDGGFGEVFRVVSDSQERALKLVPKAPGAERELLFVDLGTARNVVPILEVAETDEAWAMLMPLAECSLRDKIESSGPLPLDSAIAVVTDICTTLADLEDRVVHRDIKPENILLLDGRWCLADFGIARYAEATTDEHTKKYALTAAYCAPERWRFERATSATDVYSVGVVMYELLTGKRPFDGPSTDDFREQHLHLQSPVLKTAPAPIAAMCEECLYKAPGARPSAANLIARLERLVADPASENRARLAAANLAEVRRRAERARKRSQESSEEERRRSLFEAAKQSHADIAGSLLNALSEEAPAAQIARDGRRASRVQLGEAVLTFSDVLRTETSPWNWDAPAFDVIAHASLTLSIPSDRYGYSGRNHAFWFCDAVEANTYAWYETAFMISPLLNQRSPTNPFSLPPGESAAKALSTGIAEYQIAWPFERLERGDLREFIDRWVGWLADAATGRLRHPRSMPERSSDGSWRKK